MVVVQAVMLDFLCLMENAVNQHHLIAVLNLIKLVLVYNAVKEVILIKEHVLQSIHNVQTLMCQLLHVCLVIQDIQF